MGIFSVSSVPPAAVTLAKASSMLSTPT